ncbi:unnamed protein product [Acanthoscelides obtectus]|uniref:Uncharacterized protein n=1 Tax=Acanthoscelides obtectus TaxID=200917 RepID=A0A9P0K5U1_ACAOB|nr:unnamed protein product [Acanthoscelides obtectus]CAK1676800.1 hypothetical protein AOBTE_LOCUS30947 [Acanthoscelides obtectus]
MNETSYMERDEAGKVYGFHQTFSHCLYFHDSKMKPVRILWWIKRYGKLEILELNDKTNYSGFTNTIQFWYQ